MDLKKRVTFLQTSRLKVMLDSEHYSDEDKKIISEEVIKRIKEERREKNEKKNNALR